MNDLSAVPPVWFLFGLSGSGKSYVGDVIARHTGWDIYHADEDITPAMKLALAESRPFTVAMRDEYFQLLAQKIRARQRPGKPLLVTQGAYKQYSRDFLQNQVPGLQFVWVDAPDALVVERLQHRQDGISTRSAVALRGDFEPPSGGLCIVNDKDQEHILSQFRACLTRFQQPEGAGG